MKTHVEIRIRLSLKDGTTLHDVLRQFARKTQGWSFPVKESRDYQHSNRRPAGFVDCDSVGRLKPAHVAIANLDQKHPNSFRVTNIIPKKSSSFTLEEYNAIGLAFAHQFGNWRRKNRVYGEVRIIGPDKKLKDIIPGEKSRMRFEAWLRTPTPLGHPNDLYVLNCFICHLFRHPGRVRTYELEPYLVQDRGWTPALAHELVARIETGLALLRVDRKF
ncbi:MAG TPA: hypothetical protein VFC44_13350 [Candidatus Saccharimonadales bacterium]|nr:hypothetical protein [Candidatus Saccharimonadales bacterium]